MTGGWAPHFDICSIFCSFEDVYTIHCSHLNFFEKGIKIDLDAEWGKKSNKLTTEFLIDL